MARPFFLSAVACAIWAIPLIAEDHSSEIENARPAFEEPGRSAFPANACSFERPSRNPQPSLISQSVPQEDSTAIAEEAPSSPSPPSSSNSLHDGDTAKDRPYTDMASLLKGQCFQCHQSNDPIEKKRLFDEQGRLVPERIPAVLNLFEGKVSAPMRKIWENQILPQLSESEKTLIADWLRENGRVAHAPEPALAESRPEAEQDLANLDVEFGAKPPEGQSDASEGLKKAAPILEPSEVAQKMKEGAIVLYVGDKENSGHFKKIKGSYEVGSFLDAQLKQTTQKLEELEKQLGPNAKNKEIILYCGCCPTEHCEYSWRAAWHLKRRGYTHIKLVNFRGKGLEKEWERLGESTEAF